MSDLRVVITGMGVVSPFGVGTPVFWENIAQGNSAASLIDSFDASMLPVRFAAQVPLTGTDLDSLIEKRRTTKTMSRSAKFAVICASEAVSNSGLDTTQTDPYRVGTSLGTGGLGLHDLEYAEKTLQIFCDSINENDMKLDNALLWKNTLERVHPLTPLKALPNIPTAHIAINYNARGHCQTITTACTSAAQAIGEAYRQIKSGICDVMIAGGADSIVNPHGIVAFSGLGVLSKNNDEFQTAARPFDKRRDGFMLGEGGAIFVLEELGYCRARGGEILGEIVGYASTNDAYRLTDEPANAWGSIEAMRQVLSGAGVSPGDVDYINAHGTGTPMNDKTETLAIRAIFGGRAYSPPVSSTKSMIGHLVAAAGGVEFATCVLALNHQVLPPTINYEEPDSECDLDYVPNEARKAPLDVILCNSFGFGGQNACLLLRNV
jgi:3-oxoacyl-[acyl-carrier-protein] synthase II